MRSHRVRDSILLALVAAIVVAIVGALFLPLADASTAETPRMSAARMAYELGELAPCPTEDSSNCYWDARTRGNGRGRSFWVDDHGHVFYEGGQAAPHAAAISDPGEPYCQYDAEGHDIVVLAHPGAHVKVRVRGRTFRATIHRGDRFVGFTTRKRVNQLQVKAWADGRRCEGT